MLDFSGLSKKLTEYKDNDELVVIWMNGGQSYECGFITEVLPGCVEIAPVNEKDGVQQGRATIPFTNICSFSQGTTDALQVSTIYENRKEAQRRAQAKALGQCFNLPAPEGAPE